MKHLIGLLAITLISFTINAQKMEFTCMESHDYNRETGEYVFAELFEDNITISIEEDRITFNSVAMDRFMIWFIKSKETKVSGSTFYKCVTKGGLEITVISNPDYPGIIYGHSDIKNYLMNCN